MTDHLTDFAAVAADCVHDIATGTLVDALASLEHALGSLRGPQLYAGKAVARALHKLAGGHPVSTREPVEEALYLARTAAWWAQLSPTRASMAEVGASLERGRIVVSMMDADTCRHLQQLLRMVLSAVERSALSGEGRVHVAA